MAESIPDDPLACWHDSRFREAQEHMLVHIGSLPWKDRPGMSQAERILWDNARPVDIRPSLTDSAVAESRGSIQLKVQRILHLKENDDCILTLAQHEEEDAEVFDLGISIKHGVARRIFKLLEDEQKAAVLRFVYSERQDDLERRRVLQAKKRRYSATNKLVERLNALETGFMHAMESMRKSR